MGFGSGDAAFANRSVRAQARRGDVSRRDPGMARVHRATSTSSTWVVPRAWSSLQLVEQGNRVTGVDREEWPTAWPGSSTASWSGDLDQGLPEEIRGRYDVVLAADVLEHLREPGDLLAELAGHLAPNGWVLASIPNAVHWYPRLRMLSGRFDYDRRGILDRGHLRFFTRRSFERLAKTAGLRVTRCQAVGLPVEILNRGGGDIGGLAEGTAAAPGLLGPGHDPDVAEPVRLPVRDPPRQSVDGRLPRVLDPSGWGRRRRVEPIGWGSLGRDLPRGRTRGA